MKIDYKKIVISIIAILVCLIMLIYITKQVNNNHIIHWKDYLKVTNTYVHNKNTFTQGIFFYNNKMYETGGLYGKSCIYKDIDLKTGIANKTYKFDNSVFAEGSVIFNDKLYVLTYKENKAFIFNKETLELEKEYSYKREGWGLTTDGENLIASDGTSNLFFLDKDLELVKTVNVKINRKRSKKHK